MTTGGNNKSKWDKIRIGDVAIFSKDGYIYTSSVVTLKIINTELAFHLWGENQDNERWENIYFLDEIKKLKIPYADFNKSVKKKNGEYYDEGYVIQGFNVLSWHQAQEFIELFDLYGVSTNSQVEAEEFETVIKKLSELESTSKISQTLVRTEQSYQKQILFGLNKIFDCACCHKPFPVEFLVTAHIKKRQYCTEAERKDKNIVMPMCKFGCDELYEKGFITVSNGKFIAQNNKQNNTAVIDAYLTEIDNNQCTYYSDLTKDYFEWHMKHHSRSVE